MTGDVTVIEYIVLHVWLFKRPSSGRPRFYLQADPEIQSRRVKCPVVGDTGVRPHREGCSFGLRDVWCSASPVQGVRPDTDVGRSLWHAGFSTGFARGLPLPPGLVYVRRLAPSVASF